MALLGGFGEKNAQVARKEPEARQSTELRKKRGLKITGDRG